MLPVRRFFHWSDIRQTDFYDRRYLGSFRCAFHLLILDLLQSSQNVDEFNLRNQQPSIMTVSLSACNSTDNDIRSVPFMEFACILPESSISLPVVFGMSDKTDLLIGSLCSRIMIRVKFFLIRSILYPVLKLYQTNAFS